jgi:hypothetical protein
VHEARADTSEVELYRIFYWSDALK